MKIGRSAKVATCVVGLLLVVEAATYLLLAERAMPVAAVRSLRDYDLLRGRRFALVPRETRDAMSAAQQAALAAELKRHVQVIYHSRDEIPETSLVTRPITEKDVADYEKWKRDGRMSGRTLERRKLAIERGHHVMGYRDGARIGWELDWRAPFLMKSRASMWVASEGAEWREDVYVWLLGWWVRVWNTSHGVA